MKKYFIYYSTALVSIISGQEIFTEYLIVGQDTLDIFSYQIPENYNNDIEHTMLVTFHQWGGNENSNYISFPISGYSLAMDFPYSKRINNILTELDKIVLKFQGRVYLSKDTRLSSFYFSKFYNNIF